MKKLIVFDMDGTLYRSETSFIPAIEEFLKRYNHQVPPLEVLYSFIGEPGHVFVHWIETLNIGKPLSDLIAEFNELEKQAVVDYGELYPETVEILEWLTDHDYHIALCSNGHEWYIDAIMNKFNLHKLIKDVKFPRSKDDTKIVMLKELITVILPDISYMMGDRYHDLEGAHENGMRFIGALYGFGSQEIGAAPKVVTSLSEIRDLLSE